jgi:hypothetical protein
MGKPKYDGVVECVHYKPNGEVDWVRAYERRGATFSDYVVISRAALIQKLRSGKKFVVGKRVPEMASTFDVTTSLRLSSTAGKDVLVSDEDSSDQDHLPGVPVF